LQEERGLQNDDQRQDKYSSFLNALMWQRHKHYSRMRYLYPCRHARRPLDAAAQ